MPLPSTDTYKKVVQNQHRIRSRAILLQGGVDTGVALKLTDGNASDDRTNNIRSKCSANVVDPKGDLVPESSSDYLYPGYNEVQLLRGVYLPDGTLEEKSLGIFAYADITSSDSGENKHISLSGFDRSQRVTDARFLDETVVSGNVLTIIQGIVTARVPNARFNLTPSSYTVNQQTYARGDDPWQACIDLANSIGMDIFFDRNGVCTMIPFPNINASPDWVFTEDEQAVILSLDKKLSRSEYNHWIEIAEGTNIPVPFKAEAMDTADVVASGDRPYFHVSSLFTNVGQCQAAANAKMSAQAGATQQIQLTTIPNAAILVNDLIGITNTWTKTAQTFIVDKVTTPLTATSGQNFTTRSRTL